MITSDWYDKTESIIMMRFSGSLILGEVADAGKSCYELSQQAQGRFDIIADLGQAGYTPPVGILWHWIQQSQSHHLTYPNWGLAVVVAENPLFLAYFEEGIMQSDSIRTHCRCSKTLDEAVAIIQADRQLARI